MVKIEQQMHEIDKRLTIVEREVQELQLLANDLGDNVGEIKARHHLEDYKRSRNAKFFDFSLKNWRVLFSIGMIIFGLYEAARALYLAPSPKYNTQYKVKDDKPNR